MVAPMAGLLPWQPGFCPKRFARVKKQEKAVLLFLQRWTEGEKGDVLAHMMPDKTGTGVWSRVRRVCGILDRDKAGNNWKDGRGADGVLH